PIRGSFWKNSRLAGAAITSIWTAGFRWRSASISGVVMIASPRRSWRSSSDAGATAPDAATATLAGGQTAGSAAKISGGEEAMARYGGPCSRGQSWQAIMADHDVEEEQSYTSRLPARPLWAILPTLSYIQSAQRGCRFGCWMLCSLCTFQLLKQQNSQWLIFH
ncbi:MAG: hypothetical protein UZ07_CHB004001986, partial [Chlorobi bacterium OLB7]